jgi:hypothetical protein
MPSPNTLLKVAMLASALITVQSAHGPARAGEEAGLALQASVAQTVAVAERRGGGGKSSGQPRHGVAAEFELVTGDGQQGSVAAKPIACVAPYAECTP